MTTWGIVAYLFYSVTVGGVVGVVGGLAARRWIWGSARAVREAHQRAEKGR